MKFFGKEEEPQDPKSKLEKRLDTPLYRIPDTKIDISWADSVEGTLIMGATGSGKSSGPGQHIALAMLKADFGMCVLCAKKGERGLWEKYAEKAGRSKDLVIFNKQSSYQFDFLQYEMTRDGEGAAEPTNMVNTLMGLHEQNRVFHSGGQGQESEKFWDQSLRRLISRSITLLRLAKEPVNITNIRKLVSSCFDKNDLEEYENILSNKDDKEIDKNQQKSAKQAWDSWLKESYFLSTIVKLPEPEADDTTTLAEDIRWIRSYWLREFARLSERTRSIIIESFMGVVEPFFSGILREKFSGGLSEELHPENIYQQKKIVIIDFSIKEYGLAGIYASTLFKSTFQACMERREVETEPNEPFPAGLWVDEYQNFCSPKTDTLFQTTARSSWVATVYITQNINNIYFTMGDKMAEARAKSLLGNMNLKLFCNNADIQTNKWASDMIGRHLVETESVAINEKDNPSKTYGKEMQYRITPDHYTNLKTGREKNKFKVEAVIFKPGIIWDKRKGTNFFVAEFDQKAQ